MKSSSFANAQSYTFVVNDVELAQSLLPTEKPKQLIESVLKYPLEACSNYSRNLLSGISTNPLVTAAKLAFDQHRPLVLYPDAIWLTLVQGISEHIVAQGESISRRILRFGEGRIEIPVSTDSFPIGSLENPWDEIISSACNQVLSYVRHDFHWLFETSYSTTQPTDRTAVEISLLAGLDRHVGMFDTWQICGFPSITLEGTLDDWCLLQSKLANFGKLGLGWWAKKLKPLMHEFVSSIRGNPDRGFWKRWFTKILHFNAMRQKL